MLSCCRLLMISGHATSEATTASNWADVMSRRSIAGSKGRGVLGGGLRAECMGGSAVLASARYGFVFDWQLTSFATTLATAGAQVFAGPANSTDWLLCELETCWRPVCNSKPSSKCTSAWKKLTVVRIQHYVIPWPHDLSPSHSSLALVCAQWASEQSLNFTFPSGRYIIHNNPIMLTIFCSRFIKVFVSSKLVVYVYIIFSMCMQHNETSSDIVLAWIKSHYQAVKA